MPAREALRASRLPPVFVISLANSFERRAVLGARLSALGLDYTVIDAVDGRGIDHLAHPAYDRFRRLLFFGRDLTAGEIGCLLSHCSIYRLMVERGIERALVLEDDAVLTDDFPAVLDALIRSKVSFDLVRFLHQAKVQRDARRVGPLVGNYVLASVPGTPGNAHAYLLNRRAAERLLLATRKNWVPIDTTQGQVWRTGLKAYVVLPSPARQDERMASTIGDVRFDKTARIQGWMRAIYPFMRLLWKLYEFAGKRYSALRHWPERIRDRRILEAG